MKITELKEKLDLILSQYGDIEVTICVNDIVEESIKDIQANSKSVTLYNY